jgi:DNA modification methylase
MIKILQGNCIDKIKELDDNSIDCVVSSPPYFGLRDYGVDGQFGLEKTYHDYLANTVKVFETFKPKLKDTATIWWNVGDSYHNYRPTNNKQGMYKKPDYPKQSIAGNRQDLPKHSLKRNQRYQEIKEKDLMMMPNRVAIALQDAGWYIRSEIIWHKPNPMPESVRDRPTSCHEKIWLITKSKKYYYDSDAIREPTTDSYKGKRGLVKKRNKTQSAMQDRVFNTPYHPSNTKNKRNVWTITTKPFKDAHFATFPKDLIEPCIKAGCPEKVCVECGFPYISNYKRTDNNKNFIQTKGKDTPNIKKGGVRLNENGTTPHFNPPTIEFLNLKKNCNCKTDEFKSGVVLDPFGGSGTTGIVAALNNRNAILIELNQNYIDIANKRIDKEVGLFSG